MSLTKEERQHIENIIRANKWYTYEEAENILKSHWDTSKDGEYLTTKRRQIQKIIKSDVIGTYLEINKKTKNLSVSDNDWNLKKIYGWSKKETYYLGEENENGITETLHVFPKYDNLFQNNLEKSIVLSSFDEDLGDIYKVQMREIYEKIVNDRGRGKTPYLMTEPYLFALKHEIERREYPTKRLYLLPNTPKEIISELDQTNFRNNIPKIIDKLYTSFFSNVNEEIKTYNRAKSVEKNRCTDINNFLLNWKEIYPEIIKKIEQKFSKDLERFKDLLNKIDHPFIYHIDKNNEKAKLLKKYSPQKIKNVDNSVLRNKIKNSVYSFEKYNLEKLEIELSKEDKFILEVAQYRHTFSNKILEYLKKENCDSILIVAFENIL